MSKIICDLCGTAYPDTADQCPICGTAKTESSAAYSESAHSDSRTPVRGGRFSQSNVRKRTGETESGTQRSTRRSAPQDTQGPASKRWVAVVVAIMVLVIIFICAYIAIKAIDIFNPSVNSNPSDSQSSSTEPVRVPCQSVTLSQSTLEFTAANGTILLEPILIPADTTDPVQFYSSNEAVVKVDSNGLVTPVANGEAVITVICGDTQAQCTVICNIGIIPTDPSGPSETQPITPPTTEAVQFMLNRAGFTLSGYGSSHDLTNKSVDNVYNPGYKYVGPVDKTEINWSSDDPTVATVKNGVVTAVGNGNTYIRAEYKGIKVSCQVICRNVVAPPAGYDIYELSQTEATVAVGESFTLYLRQKDTMARVQGVTYRVADESLCSVDEKGRVTGLDGGQTKVVRTTIYVIYEDFEYEFTLYVKPASAD